MGAEVGVAGGGDAVGVSTLGGVDRGGAVGVADMGGVVCGVAGTQLTTNKHAIQTTQNAGVAPRVGASCISRGTMPAFWSCPVGKGEVCLALTI